MDTLQDDTANMNKKLTDELQALAIAMLYFAAWIGMLVLLKKLVLAEYSIEFRDWSIALLGALILTKVVLVLEHIPLGWWVRKQPAVVDVIVRTALYGVGVLAVLLLEKAFDGRHEHGGFVPSLMSVFQHADIYHVWANLICLSGALLGYNLLSVIRQQLGGRELIRAFLSPLAKEPRGKQHGQPPRPKETLPNGADRKPS